MLDDDVLVHTYTHNTSDAYITYIVNNHFERQYYVLRNYLQDKLIYFAPYGFYETSPSKKNNS
jgi:hypothetical protein